MNREKTIFAVTTIRYAHTFTNHFISPWGSQTRPLFQQISYKDLVAAKTPPTGHYIFSDIERLGHQMANTVAEIWETLDSKGEELRLLNHPTRSMRRYELLRTLYEEGINPFNVYRVTDLRKPEHYPVFIRTANGHAGALTELLNNAAELDEALLDIHKRNICREDLMIVEFCDTADAGGIYRKYAVFRVGDRLISRHQLTSESWMLKYPDLLEKKYLEEELAFLHDDQFHDRIMHVFELGHIDYGRIDYSLEQGKLRVWEINTNPMLCSPDDGCGETRRPVHKKFSESFHQATRDLATQG